MWKKKKDGKNSGYWLGRKVLEYTYSCICPWSIVTAARPDACRFECWELSSYSRWLCAHGRSYNVLTALSVNGSVLGWPDNGDGHIPWPRRCRDGGCALVGVSRWVYKSERVGDPVHLDWSLSFGIDLLLGVC